MLLSFFKLSALEIINLSSFQKLLKIEIVSRDNDIHCFNSNLVNIRDSSLKTPLLKAVESRSLTLVSSLLKPGGDVNFSCGSGYSPMTYLLSSLENGDEQVFDVLKESFKRKILSCSDQVELYSKTIKLGNIYIVKELHIKRLDASQF